MHWSSHQHHVHFWKVFKDPGNSVGFFLQVGSELCQQCWLRSECWLISLYTQSFLSPSDYGWCIYNVATKDFIHLDHCVSYGWHWVWHSQNMCLSVCFSNNVLLSNLFFCETTAHMRSGRGPKDVSLITSSCPRVILVIAGALLRWCAAVFHLWCRCHLATHLFSLCLSLFLPPLCRGAQ